ncbi:hypothetical protein ACJ73_09057 [Blastomyces percursus]|uniref:Uncharacterized protein n=1 Tax=Blastomyces percursus TaxID=1658174 RepID=A0A1J9QFD4_9EURO|nr:hypothetical protein ACJ73_09057 [Blastomyces percursus]
MVREVQERYEQGEIDANTLVYAIARKDTKHNMERDSKSPSELDCPANPKSRRLTLSTELEESVSPMQSKDTSFSMPISTTFEPLHSFISMVGIKPKYEGFTDVHSQSSTSDCKHLDYLNGLSQAGQHMAQSCTGPGNQTAGTYVWSSPFHPLIFSTVDYGSGMAMLPNYMPHSMTMMMPSLSQGPFPLPDLHGTGAQMEDMSSANPALRFHNGSLGHPYMVHPQQHLEEHNG